MDKLRIVSATREPLSGFVNSTLLGRSIKNLAWDSRIETDITCSNTLGLPHIYNRAIEESKDDQTLLFVHDDIIIDDYHLFTRLEDALKAFDVVGVIGNTRPAPNQLTWTHTLDENKGFKPCERSVLSGIIGQIDNNNQRVFAYYGVFPQACAAGRVLSGGEGGGAAGEGNPV